MPPVPWSLVMMTAVSPFCLAKFRATLHAASKPKNSLASVAGSLACAAQSTRLPSTISMKPLSLLLSFSMAMRVDSASDGYFVMSLSIS